MKKAAFKFKPGSGTILAFLILAFVFASIAGIVFVVISQSSAKTPNAAAASSLACTFSPASVDVGKSITVTSNRGNVFGEVTIQGAYLNTAVPIGILAKQSSATVMIPPVTSGLYVVRVGSPAVNCKTTVGGDLAIQNTVLPTPTPSVVGASNLTITNQTCNTATGMVNVAFHWTPQPNGAFFVKSAQWLDLSSATGVDPFSVGNYVNQNVFGLDSYITSTPGGNIGPLVPGTVHFWRINTLNSLNNSWYPSKTPQFTTINCVALPTVSD